MSAIVTGETPPPAGSPPGLRQRLWLRFGHLVQELGKFGTVGGVAFVIDVVIYNLARQTFDLETLTAKIISASLAATVAFIGNRFWTWRHRERSGLAREYGLYFFFNALGIGVSVAVLAISHYGLGSVWPFFQTAIADNIAANIVGTAFGTLVRFWSYKRFVFIAPSVSLTDTLPVPGDTTDSD